MVENIGRTAPEKNPGQKHSQFILGAMYVELQVAPLEIYSEQHEKLFCGFMEKNTHVVLVSAYGYSSFSFPKKTASRILMASKSVSLLIQNKRSGLGFVDITDFMSPSQEKTGPFPFDLGVKVCGVAVGEGNTCVLPYCSEDP